MPTPGPKPTASTDAPGAGASSSTAATSMSRFSRAITAPASLPDTPPNPAVALLMSAPNHLK